MSINFAFLKNELKNKRIVIIFYTLALALSFILLTAINNNDNMISNYEDFGLMFFIFSTGLYIFMFFIVSLFQFDFFHTKKKLDVYHSLPTSRSSLFLTNLLVVPIMIMVPYFLMNILNIELSGILINGSDIEYIAMGKQIYYSYLFKLFVISIFSYSVMVLASTVTTNKITHGVVSISVLFLPIIFIFCITYFFSNVINYGINIDRSILYLFSFFTVSYGDSFYGINYLSVALQLILSVIFYCLAFYSYNSFKSENVTKKITNKVLEKVFVAIISFSISIIIVLLLMEFDLYSTPIVVLAFLSIFSLIFLVASWILNKKIQMKPFIISLGLCAVFLFVAFFDIFRLGNYAPKKEVVEYITIDERIISKDMYDEVRGLQKDLFSDRFADTQSVSKLSNQNVELVYNTGKIYDTERIYNKGDLSFYSDLETIVENEANREVIINRLENFKDELEKLDYAYASYQLFGTGESFPIRETDYKYSDTSHTTEYVTVIDALIKDIQEDKYFTSFTDTNAIIGKIDIGGYGGDGNYSFIPAEIKSTYTNTLSFLGKDDIYKGKVLVIAEDVYLNDDIDKALANGVEYVHVGLDLGIDIMDTDVYVQGDNDSRTYGNTTFDELYEYTVSSAEYNEVRAIKYDENPEEFLNIVNNKVVNYNIEQVLPVEEGTVFSAYIFSEYDANTKKLIDTYTTVEIKGDIKNIETNVKYIGSFYE